MMETLTDREFAKRMLTVVLGIRDAEKVRDEDVTDDYIEGYEQGLSDFAQWLVEEFDLNPQEDN